MAQWRLTKTLFSTRHNQMWSFLREIPKWLARSVSARMGREAQARVMYRGSASSRNISPTVRSARAVHPLVIVCLVGIGTFQPTIVVLAAERCPAPTATRVVSVQGNVTWSLLDSATLQAAKLNDTLCVGDTVRVGAKSRAVLRLPNETTIPLDQNTIFRLKQSISEKEPTLIELIQGAIHVITRTPKPFKVDTPYLNATVEGTEFYVGVDSVEARVVVVEGKVNVSNELGALLLTDNEAATAKKGQAPQKTLTIKPRDAVQWALYYPPLFDPRSRTGGQNLAASYELYSQGKITDAIESLNTIPEAERNDDYYSYRAGLLLLVGRADEAEPDIETALKENGNNTDALSLKAIIAIVRNDKVKALDLANQAVSIDDKSAAARIALSYALQANFKIEEALKAARQATERDANSALAWARVAELELSIPNYDKSKEAAQQAVKLNPNLARTQSVLGFANLTRIDIKAAKESFNKAIELDQADPLPRLGIGIAIIREGHLEEGREQIEIATSLDPNNSLIRSYLGKAYYEEKRDTEAGKQFDLAKQRDPRDPTPYLYDAIRKQSENRPVEALQDLEKSIGINDDRAIFRSRLLLDEDRAVRTASLARIYDDLGFERLAVIEASKSLSEDPLNHSAHRFLADAYERRQRYEIARVSELLQAQLLQPLNMSPVQPRLAFTDLNSLSISGFSEATLNEYSLLFERDRPLLTISAIGGNHSTWGNEAVVSGLNGGLSYSVGQYHYQTDGFRANNDFKHEIYNLFAQFALAPQLNFQAEVRSRNTNHGDLSLNFDPKSLFPRDRTSIDQESYRLGARYSPSSNSNLLVSLIHNKREEKLDTFLAGFPDIHDDTRRKADAAEIQYIRTLTNLSFIMGVGQTKVKNNDVTIFDFTQLTGGLPCLPDFDCRLPSNFNTRASNEYFYSNLEIKTNLRITLGLSHDKHDQPTLQLGTWNPKLGLQWTPSERVRVRFAAFRTLKRELVTDQTVEPTNIVGFNQFFDDFNGTRTRFLGLGLDFRPVASLHTGFEVSKRHLIVPSLSSSGVSLNSQDERFLDAYIHWNLRTHLTLSSGFQLDRFGQPVELITGSPTRLFTATIPISARYFAESGFFGMAGCTFVRQEVERASGSALPSGTERFVVVNGVAGYRLPGRKGIIKFELNNIFDKKFSFQDDRFRTSEARTPRYTPARNVFLRASVNF